MFSCQQAEEPTMDQGQAPETRAFGDTPVVAIYVETNDTNPLNAGDYTMSNGKPFAGIVELFASNVRKRTVNGVVEPKKWIAIFPLGTEAWTEHRRKASPRLLPAVVDNSGGAVNVALGARRLPYPVEEYTENPTNLQAAVSALNGESVNGAGDTQGTRVWWDRKNLN